MNPLSISAPYYLRIHIPLHAAIFPLRGMLITLLWPRLFCRQHHLAMLGARRCTSVSPQEPGCEWINAATAWLQPSGWPKRAVGDPKRPDPCALIKQLIPRRQVACLLAEWHYLVDAWSYGHKQDIQVLIQLTCSSIIQTLSWRRCSAAGTEMRPWIRKGLSSGLADAHATEPTCIKFVRCEHRDLRRGAARRAM